MQRDIGQGIIVDVSYLGWVNHHGFNLSGYDLNGIAPYTDWKPTPGAGTNSCGQVTQFLDPTAAAVKSNCTGGAFLSTNLIRSMVGFQGWQNINLGTNQGEANYNALQLQFNKRFGKRLQFGVNYTWSKNLSYSPNESNQWIDTRLTRAETFANRPHVVNANFGYKLQNGTSLLPTGARNYVTRLFLDGWNVNGVLSFYSGNPYNVDCAVSGAPIGYWFGTPTDTPGLRCQMAGTPFLADGSKPSTVASITDQRLWYPIAACANSTSAADKCSITPSFVLPGADSFGLGNEPLTLFYGPGFENADISVSKTITLGNESRTLEFRAEAFNTLNHMNPGGGNNGANLNTSLTYNYVTNAQTNANIGAITGVQNTARHMALSLRFRF